MRSWAHPDVPRLPGVGTVPVLRGTPNGTPARIERPDDAGPTGLYVCGITPYDATHLGHAATYVTFDLLARVLRDAGLTVDYAQNVTDVDDPLLERAARDGIDWRDLAAREIDLFREDMESLRVLPPQAYIGVVERIEEIARTVRALLDRGAAYPVAAADAVADGAVDVYLDLSRQPTFGQMSGWSREQMLGVYADRGGDPDRDGKRDALDPSLWRAARAGEPSWEADGLSAGRPGWHIECTCIAVDHLGPGFAVQGGGIDLVFPHHEMSAVQADALYGPGSFARDYVHQEMVGLHGQKMSKSKGNLVLVSQLRREGVDPMAVRLVLLAEHYRTPWDWADDKLAAAQARLEGWRAGLAGVSYERARGLLAEVRRHLAADLDTAAALGAIDACVGVGACGGTGSHTDEGAKATDTAAGAARRNSGTRGDGEALVRDILDALLGVVL